MECIKDCELNNINKYEFRFKCYPQCPNESKQSIDNEYYCEALCDENKPFIIVETQECVEWCSLEEISKSCFVKYIGEINEEINQNNKEKIEEVKKEKQIKIQEKILTNIDTKFTNESYNTSELDKGYDYSIKIEKMTITLTTTDNQKIINKNDTSSKINISQCEDILRNVYNISEDKNIYMIKIDFEQDNLKIPKIKYELYSKLNESNLIKLNKSYCNNVKVEFSVYVILTDDIDKHNASSGYYNDICYPSTSNSGTDIILKDRKNEFIEGNKAVCQDECFFSDYDYNTTRALCSCDIKESTSLIDYINIDKNKLFKNLVNIKNIANINILKCYKKLFSINGIRKNMGFFIFIPIIIFHIICIILFYYKYFNLIQGKIKDIVYGITNWKLVKKDNKAKKLKQKLEREKLREQKKEIMNINNNNANNTINVDLININKINLENKNVIKMKNPIPNLITNNNNSYFDKNDNNFNPPKKVIKKNKMIVINNYNKNKISHLKKIFLNK